MIHAFTFSVKRLTLRTKHKGKILCELDVAESLTEHLREDVQRVKFFALL